ncbi:MAG: serpin family protein [Clostridiales bacterium]|nr:serpin family protein [Clostridiales bacterium]
MRKAIVILMMSLLMFSLFACGNAGSEQASDTGTDTVKVETGNLMDASWVKTASEDEIDSYFEALYKENGIDESIRANALELFKALALKDIKEGKNTMISPLSFMTAMGLLENGAKGDSLKEIENAFGYSIEEFNEWYDAWSKLMMLQGGDTLKIANSVWYKSDPLLKVYSDYLEKAALIYDAQAYKEPFDEGTLDKINEWVKANTNEMIPQILDRISSESVMYLINATCFEGAWYKDYEEDQIKEDEIFTKEDGTEETAVMLYSREERGMFFENDFLTGTSKEYRNGFRISFLLPKEGVTLEDALTKLQGDELSRLTMEGITADVDLVIPEFSFDYTAPDCVTALKEMGIKTVFDEENADLSNMAVSEDMYNLYVDTIIHKTRIELDREGTKAAAATAIGIEKATGFIMDVPVKEVRLDRPFIFIISDINTSTPIFMGTVGSISG